MVPASNRETTEREYERIKKKYYDATHNCFAYQLGIENKDEFRYSDDGEPSGTGGRPIYDAILAHKLTLVLVVVTRYYGGVKLGTGGLARAYRQCADQVLTEARICERLIMQPFRIKFEHEHTSIVMKTLADFDIRPLNTVYGDGVTIASAIRLSRFVNFESELRERTHGKLKVEKDGEPHA